MIHVVHRTLYILACIAQHRKEELPMCDTVHALSLNHSTCCNILKTLMERGFVHTPREEWKGIANETSPVRTLKEIKKTGIATQASKAMILGIAVPVEKAGKVVACLAVFCEV